MLTSTQTRKVLKDKDLPWGDSGAVVTSPGLEDPGLLTPEAPVPKPSRAPAATALLPTAHTRGRQVGFTFADLSSTTTGPWLPSDQSQKQT